MAVNHDARDFIRATLLHILDQFEKSSMFMDFFNEQQFISKDMNLTPMQEKSKIEEQAKEWLVNLTPEAKGIAESILEKSSYSIDQLMRRVNKLTGEVYFEERLGEYIQIDELIALYMIADDLRINSDLESKLSHSQAPETTVVNVGQDQTKDGIKLTLLKVELAAEYTAAFLTVEKTNNDDHAIAFYNTSSKAVQGEKEFKVTFGGPNYKKIRNTIPYGIKEYGAVIFEEVDYNEPAIKFEFEFHLFPSSYLFIFEVQIPR